MLLGLLTFRQPPTQAWHEDGSGPGERNSGLTWGRGTTSTSTSQVSVSGLQSRLFFPLPLAGVDDGEEKFIHLSIYLFFSEHLWSTYCLPSAKGTAVNRRDESPALKEMTSKGMMQLKFFLIVAFFNCKHKQVH